MNTFGKLEEENDHLRLCSLQQYPTMTITMYRDGDGDDNDVVFVVPD